MRTSPLRPTLESLGARFGERYEVETAMSFDDPATEYRRVRDGAAITDFSFTQKYRIPEQAALDYLDDLFAGNVARIRFGRALHTFLADADGRIMADCYIANNDEEFILLCESIITDASLDKTLTSAIPADAGLENLTDSHVVINVDGYKSWAVVRDLFGPDVLGLPYLSIETYQFENTDVQLIRGGKTSEFGYSVLAPAAIGESLYRAMLESARANEGGVCGAAIHNDLRLEGRFFNIFAEGAAVGDPLALGLQWMIDFEKEQFLGRDSVMARRAAGVDTKVVGLRADADADQFMAGGPLYDDNQQAGALITVCHSYILDAKVGLGVLPASIAYSGVPLRAGAPDGPEARIISMPPIMPKSLTVKLDEL